METKLTLKLDKDVIDSVKEYAHSSNKSVSKMVEEYFRIILVENKTNEKITPLVQSLSGVISESELDSLDYSDYLEKKYE